MIFEIDTGKYFDRRNKKRVLSNQSKAEKDLKRQHEQSPNVSCLENLTTPGDVIKESLKFDDCVQVLINCLKHLAKYLKELLSLAK